jgi:hypothetical protein
MVSPEKVHVLFKLHNTITAYRVSKMVMMNMCVSDHCNLLAQRDKRNLN